MQKILVHSCCGPCSTYSLKVLKDSGFKVISLFYNPNIHPHMEHSLRKEAFRSFAQQAGYEAVIEESYGLKYFLDTVKDFCYDRKARCEACYRMRLSKTAKLAGEMGIDAFSTTLTISPYQDHEAIERVGLEVGRESGVEFRYFDFRGGYRESIQMSLDMGLYRQKYCGCIFSEEERYS